VNCEGEDGDRPLHLACLYGHLECVQILLTAGASMEVRDEDGGTPLHDACAGGYKEIVSLLLQSATSPEQIRRLLDAHDVDGDTVRATILFQIILLLLFIECVSVTISLLIASQQNEPRVFPVASANSAKETQIL
jgi:ankyrin repeat protein